MAGWRLRGQHRGAGKHTNTELGPPAMKNEKKKNNKAELDDNMHTTISEIVGTRWREKKRKDFQNHINQSIFIHMENIQKFH